ncbi:hypothetical protein ACFLYO_09890 [Chloroflexota bacterium]
MYDLLERIAAQEDVIVREWSRALLDLPRSPYAELSREELTPAVRRSYRALLNLMQSGDTAPLERMLVSSVELRIQQGVRYHDNIAVWLLYRQVVQRVLVKEVTDPEIWEQLIDRVDTALEWIKDVISAAYEEANALDEATNASEEATNASDEATNASDEETNALDEETNALDEEQLP